MKEQWNLFLIALTYFTRIPVIAHVEYTSQGLQQSSRYFPWVGLLIGTIAAFVYGVAALLFPLILAVLLSLAVTLLMTGAFHEDGFADCCDGFGGGWQADQVLRIMKDSRLGTYGVVGITLLIAIKVSALSALSIQEAVFALVFGHSVSRWLAISLLLDMVYVSDPDQSKSKPLATDMPVESFLIASLVIVPFLMFLGAAEFVWLVLILASQRWLFRRYLLRRIGGYTGDCLGALQQLAEVLIYLVLLAL